MSPPLFRSLFLVSAVLCLEAGVLSARAQDLPLPEGLQEPPSAQAGDHNPAAPSVGLRALVVPVHQAMISAGITGRITEMPVRPGAHFSAGDTLVSFDCAILKAELNAARAALQAARLDLKAKQRQMEFNSIGPIEVDLAKAEVARTSAQAQAVAAETEGCRIVAPYDGSVVRFDANPHETVKNGEDILEILDDRNLEVEVIVPSVWLRWLKTAQTFRLRLDETGTSHTATVTRLGARVDPASQSVLVTGRLQDPPPALRAGMSGEAVFKRPASADGG